MEPTNSCLTDRQIECLAFDLVRICRLPTETFEMRKPLLASSVVQPKYNAEAVLINFEVFIFEGIR